MFAQVVQVRLMLPFVSLQDLDARLLLDRLELQISLLLQKLSHLRFVALHAFNALVERVDLRCLLPKLLVFKLEVFHAVARLQCLLFQRLVFHFETTDEVELRVCIAATDVRVLRLHQHRCSVLLLVLVCTLLEHLQPLSQVPDRRLVVQSLLLSHRVELVCATDVDWVVAVGHVGFVHERGGHHIGRLINNARSALVILVSELPNQLLQVLVLHDRDVVVHDARLVLILVLVVHHAYHVRIRV